LLYKTCSGLLVQTDIYDVVYPSAKQAIVIVTEKNIYKQ